jgi:hypothetical protein
MLPSLATKVVALLATLGMASPIAPAEDSASVTSWSSGYINAVYFTNWFVMPSGAEHSTDC